MESKKKLKVTTSYLSSIQHPQRLVRFFDCIAVTAIFRIISKSDNSFYPFAKRLSNFRYFQNNVSLSVLSQNAVKMQSKFNQNAVKMQSKCSQNSVKINQKFSQNAVKIQSKIQSKCSQNAVKMQSKCSQNAFCPRFSQLFSATYETKIKIFDECARPY